MKDIIKVFIVILLIALCISGASCRVIQPGTRGMKITLGEINQTPLQEGVHLVLPLIQNLVRVSIQQETKADKTACFSSDLQTVTVSYSILYRRTEAKVCELYQKYKGDPYDSLILPRMHDMIKRSCAKYKAEAIVKMREEIKADVLPKLRENIGNLLTIVDISITNIDLSDKIEKAIEEKQVMEQAALAKQYELEKEKKAAEITIVQAQAEAEAVRIKGEALKQAPDVIALEIVRRWDGVSPKTVVTTEGGANVLLPVQ